MQQKALYQAEEAEKERVKSMSMAVKQWYTWFKEGQFYVYGFVYTLVRMAVNVVMTVQSFYLLNVLMFKPNERFPSPLAVALTPLFSYIFSILFQIFVYKKLTQILRNRFLPMALAILITSLGSAPLFFLDESTQNWVYACAPITQIGLAIMINTSTSLISDVIGKDAESSAFVYGFYSFMDKIANGFAIESALKYFEGSETGLRVIMGGLPIACSVLAFALTYLGKVLYSEKLARLSIGGQKNRPIVGGH